MKESLHQSLKKIKVLQDKIDHLVQRKKTKEAIIKCKKLFHLCTSFSVILMLNESYDHFNSQLELTLETWEKLIKMCPNHSFDLSWKKQVLIF